MPFISEIMTYPAGRSRLFSLIPSLLVAILLQPPPTQKVQARKWSMNQLKLLELYSGSNHSLTNSRLYSTIVKFNVICLGGGGGGDCTQ